MKRRDFITFSALAGSSTLLLPKAFAMNKGNNIASSQTKSKRSIKEMKADVVIIGGGIGGCASALAACRNGLQVIVVEETDWIGGQLSQQGVAPEEHQWIETHGAAASYRTFRNNVRNYYKRNYPLTVEA